ncbi:hypothetical protein [Weissella confusa]|uniref:hypothetical protein n=1 Tax=Weissella confusa TaxID=1583 RepID=UPI0014369284|nr:hypothetical protein [Weissella confusa]MBJ7633928.1 hypothetical protein [Weissella confusa]
MDKNQQIIQTLGLEVATRAIENAELKAQVALLQVEVQNLHEQLAEHTEDQQDED